MRVAEGSGMASAGVTRLSNSLARVSGIQLRCIVPSHNIHQWRKLLCSSTNKTHIIQFLVEEWKVQLHKIKDKVLYVTCEDACFKLIRE